MVLGEMRDFRPIAACKHSIDAMNVAMGALTMTPHEVGIRRAVQMARLAFAKAYRAKDVLLCIRAAKEVDRHERALCRYLGLSGDDDAQAA